MNVESLLFKQIGKTAGKLHTARSRNDQVVTDFKLWIRNNSVNLDKHIQKLQKSLINIAKKNTSTVMPGYTHLQVAQPISLSHHCLAYVEMMGRDRSRLKGCMERLNESPLGSGALAGTSFPIDRNFTAKLLSKLCLRTFFLVVAHVFCIADVSISDHFCEGFCTYVLSRKSPRGVGNHMTRAPSIDNVSKCSCLIISECCCKPAIFNNIKIGIFMLSGGRAN